MSILESMVWLVLSAMSLVTLACVSQAIFARGFSLRLASRRFPAGGGCARAFKELAEEAAGGGTREMPQQLRALADRAGAAAHCDPVAAVIAELCTRPVPQLEFEAACRAAILQAVDRGLLRMLGFVAKTAPSVGIAGTLVGLHAAFQDLQPGAGLPEGFVHGFAVALLSSLWGICIMLAARSCADFLWIPHLEQALSDVRRALGWAAPLSEKLHGGVNSPRPKGERTLRHFSIGLRKAAERPAVNGESVPCRDSV